MLPRSLSWKLRERPSSYNSLALPTHSLGSIHYTLSPTGSIWWTSGTTLILLMVIHMTTVLIHQTITESVLMQVNRNFVKLNLQCTSVAQYERHPRFGFSTSDAKYWNGGWMSCSLLIDPHSFQGRSVLFFYHPTLQDGAHRA